MPKLSNSISCYRDFLSFLNFYINQRGLERIEVFLISLRNSDLMTEIKQIHRTCSLYSQPRINVVFGSCTFFTMIKEILTT